MFDKFPDNQMEVKSWGTFVRDPDNGQVLFGDIKWATCAGCVGQHSPHGLLLFTESSHQHDVKWKRVLEMYASLNVSSIFEWRLFQVSYVSCKTVWFVWQFDDVSVESFQLPPQPPTSLRPLQPFVEVPRFPLNHYGSIWSNSTHLDKEFWCVISLSF